MSHLQGVRVRCPLKNAVLSIAVIWTVGGPWVDGVGAQTVGGTADAADPRSAPFNAVPNDGEDDRENLQRWIDAGCASANKLLYLPPGDWHVTHRPVPGVANAGSLRITCDGLTILGAGRSSRIVMKGTAILPSNFKGPVDWAVIEILADKITLEGVAIDGSGRSNTGEQTHLIQISGPARDTELRRLYLNLPAAIVPRGSVDCRPTEGKDRDFNTRMCIVPGHGSLLCKDLGDQPRCSLSADIYTVLGWFRGGDCVRSLGASGTVDGVSITDTYASECDRALISLQHDSRNFTITGNVTRKVTDQIVDLEPNRSGGVGKVIIMGNRLERGGASSQGAAAIALAGTGVSRTDTVLISGNILDGGIITTHVSRVSIEHNVISGQPSATSQVPVIQILNSTDSLRVIDNEIDRPVGSGAGDVISVRADDNGRPEDVTIALNTVTQATEGNVIHLMGVQNATIVANTLRCMQPLGAAFAAVKGITRAVPIQQIIVAQNRTRGPCNTFLHLVDSSPFPVGAVTVTDNQTTGLDFGVRFSESILPSITPRISDNLFHGTPPANFVTGPPGLTFNGENGPVP